MKKLFSALIFSLAALFFPAQTTEAQVAILCYHEVDKPNDTFAVTSKRLESHIKMMKDDGYHFVDLDEYIKYTKGEIALPEKSVMITFDDGYRSFYTKTYPLLKKYNVPSMLAIVSSWTNNEERPNDVRDSASWEELKEMESSGLVTVVSHTHAMHKQQQINPQGGSNGVVGSHLYFQNRYETDEEYTNRIRNDINKAQELFNEKLGHPCKAMVWPYGIYTKQAVDLAKESGMEAAFLLDGGINNAGEEARFYAKRMIISSDIDNTKLKKLLTKDHDEWNSEPLRFAQIDLDYVYDKDPAQYEENMNDMLDMLETNNINVAAVQAFADPDGDGNVDKVYFQNDEVPVEADIFNDAINRLQRRGIATVAWLPVLNYQTFVSKDKSNLVKSVGEKGWYNRISPFDKASLERVKNLFHSIAVNSQVQGILLQDDLYLGEDEDVSAYAKEAYRNSFNKEMPNPKKMSKKEKKEFVKWKVEALDNAADEALSAFKEVRPLAITMRDIYSGVALEEGADEWLGQNYQDCLSKYDYTVIMAYPYMDKAKDPSAYLKKIAKTVKDKDKVIVKIQSYDWEKEKYLNQKTFENQLKTLKKAGVKNMGYYPITYAYWK